MIGAFQVGPFQINYQQGVAAPVKPSRSHKEEKHRSSINWSIPFVVQKDQLKEVEQKIEVVKKEIQEEKNQVDYTSNIYTLNAINNRIDRLLETLEILLQEKDSLKKIVTKEVKPIIKKEVKKFNIKRAIFLFTVSED